MRFTTDEAELFNELIVQTLYGCTSASMSDRAADVDLRNSYVGGLADMSDFFEIHWMMERIGILSSDLHCRYSEMEVREVLGNDSERFKIDLLWVIGAFVFSNLYYQKNVGLTCIRDAKPADAFDVPHRLNETFQLLDACGYAARQGAAYKWTEKASPIMCALGSWQFFQPEGRGARLYVDRMIETIPDRFRALFEPSRDSWWPETKPPASGHERAVLCVSNHWYRDNWHLEGAVKEDDLTGLPYGFSIATGLAELLNAILRGEQER
ncbi:hypothetical protein [Litoreibacter roseus]|uniref:Uncharacterized protein n=1 Tax=Litoreibacter roseus TaxID=2601869 RepID=A0A6N6JJS3_9RHOB|nr:hypothetical protein [Litoreibacter roseus]GFE65689.1 hypothetical protein KIN_27630 [Litoreibacter roseus]